MLAKQQNTRVVCLWRTENYYYEELKQQQKYSLILNFFSCLSLLQPFAVCSFERGNFHFIEAVEMNLLIEKERETLSDVHSVVFFALCQT